MIIIKIDSHAIHACEIKSRSKPDSWFKQKETESTEVWNSILRFLCFLLCRIVRSFAEVGMRSPGSGASPLADVWSSALQALRERTVVGHQTA